MLTEVKIEDKSCLFEGLNEKETQKIQGLIELIEQMDYVPMKDEEMNEEFFERKEFAYHNNRLEGLFLDKVGQRIDEVFDHYRVPTNLRSELLVQFFIQYELKNGLMNK